jgi:prostaglandin-H2 D-isomerase / glutathione transferase
MVDYELVYFNGMGRAELTRLIFAAAGVKYKDTRISKSDWESYKPQSPTGSLPYLVYKNIKIPTSTAIARFAARQFDLAGTDIIEETKCDAVIETLAEIVDSYVLDVMKTSHEDTNKKEAAASEWLSKTGFEKTVELEKLVAAYGSNGYSVGNSLTWADLYIFHLVTTLLLQNPKILKACPLISDITSNVHSNERIKNWLSLRPETDF